MGSRTSGFDEWEDTLDSLPERAAREFRKVVSKGALNIKTEWRATWEASKRFPTHIPYLVQGIGYDVDEDVWLFSAEIGVSARNRQQHIAHLLEYGSIHNAPIPGGQMALDAEQPRFVEAVEALGEKLLSE